MSPAVPPVFLIQFNLMEASAPCVFATFRTGPYVLISGTVIRFTFQS